jgi:hypothetical protein
MTDAEIIAACTERDAREPHLVHYITCDTHTFKLVVAAISWASLNAGERYCMVKYGNLFESVEDAAAAIGRALTKREPVTASGHSFDANCHCPACNWERSHV